MEFEHDFPYWEMIGQDGTLCEIWINVALRVEFYGCVHLVVLTPPKIPWQDQINPKRMLRSSSWAFTALKSRSKAIFESSKVYWLYCEYRLELSHFQRLSSAKYASLWVPCNNWDEVITIHDGLFE